MPASPPLKLFIIYAREDQPALLELKAHLRPLEKRGDLTVWYDGEILPGEEWDKAIKEQLASADIVLLFISKSFFNSEYIEKEELKKALERHKKGEAEVVPIIIRPCLWDAHEGISALQVLPKDGKPISKWRDSDAAWENVARGMMALLEVFKEKAEEKRNQELEDLEDVLKLYADGKHKVAFQKLEAIQLMGSLMTARSLAILGEMYFLGRGTKRDELSALKMFELSAKNHDEIGMTYFGICYHFGTGVEKDYIKAAEWYLKAAEKGNATAQNNLGILYKNGEGVENDYIEALRWLDKSAKQNFSTAQLNLGTMHHHGLGVPQNFSKALVWYQKAAEQGNADAQNQMGYLYEQGLGCSQNYEESVKWLQKSAEQNHMVAQFNMGEMYELGKGVNQDIEKAVEWYKKAADSGYSTAKEALQRLGDSK